MENKKQDHMALIAIVAIVAIVGLFLMFFNSGTTTSTEASGDLAGQAIGGIGGRTIGEQGGWEMCSCKSGSYLVCESGDCDSCCTAEAVGNTKSSGGSSADIEEIIYLTIKSNPNVFKVGEPAILMELPDWLFMCVPANGGTSGANDLCQAAFCANWPEQCT